MNPARLWLIWTMAILGSALALAVAAPGAAGARAAAQRELVALRTTAEHTHELASLRLRLPDEVTKPQRGVGTLTERIAAALAEAGLPSSALEGVSPESQFGGNDAGGVVRRRATLTLAGTLPQIGRFLDTWRAREPTWTITGIDLAPERRSEAPPPGGDLPVRAVLTIESLSLGGAS